MAITLYKRQKELLDYLHQYLTKNNTAPTLREIAEAMNLSSLATVHEHLTALEKKKVIKRTNGAKRGIEIIIDKLTTPISLINIPLVGYIAAGKPLEVYENTLDTIQVSSELIHNNKRHFSLKVKGNSMIDDGILDGDFVIIQQQETANNGDIVVALLDDNQATLKRYYKEATRIRLEPANSTMSPIFARNVRVQGKVVGLVRNYN